MITIRADSKNKFVLEGLGKLSDNMKQAVRKSFYHTGLDIVGRKGGNNSGAVKKLMNNPKLGRTYKVNIGRGGQRLKKSRTHIASRVGQAPAILSGALRKSLDFKVKGWDRLEVSADTPYAKRLEFGGDATVNGTKVTIKKRPYLIKGILNTRRQLINNLNTEIDAIR